MPTARQLASNGGPLQLWPPRLALGAEVVRSIYIGELAGQWIHENLKTLKSDGVFEGVETPSQQLADVFRRLMVNEPIHNFRPKTLIEHPDWIHELRTPDLRIFGWFWRRRDFIASVISTKRKLADRNITYQGCIAQCCAHRNSLDLDPPKFIHGEINDLLRL